MSNLDEAFERFLLVDFEYAGGFANHGPMAVEALESIGHQALIPAFVDSYAPRLPLARTGRALRSGGARCRPRAAGACRRLGGRLRRGARERRLEGPSRCPRSPSFSRDSSPRRATACFGRCTRCGPSSGRTIRSAGASSRGAWPTGRRISDDCRGSRVRARSAGGAPAADATTDPGAFLHAIPRLAARGDSRETFDEAVRQLDGHAAFRAAIERVPLPGETDVDAFLAATCRAAAALYVAHAEARIAYVHAVTIPSAMRWLAARLSPADARRGAGYAFQAVAALHAVFGGTPARAAVDDDVARVSESWDEIRYRAACSLEEHAVKLAEACWREDRLGADPIFRLAAADAALRLEGNPNAAR